MRKVLLVDDESFIRKGIRTMIERFDTDFKDISECWNGGEALERISAERFDLVILDIRMPNMDGIAFMKEAQKFESKPKFIILSGYSDFKYAAESLKLGAKAYLLKPIQRDELLEALKKVEEELQKEEKIDNTSRKASIIIDRFKTNELNKLFLNGSLSEEQIKKILAVLEIGNFERPYRIALLKRLDMSVSDENDYIYARTLIEEYFQGSDILVNLVREDGTMAVIVPATAVFDQLIRHIKEHLGGEYAMGISDLQEGPGAIRTGFLQAEEALKYRMFAPSDVIIYFHELGQLHGSFRIPVESIRKIAEMFGTDRVREMDRILDEIFDMEALQANSIDYLEGIVDNINKYIIQFFFEHMPQKASTMKKQFEEIRNIYNFRNIQEYYHTLRNSIAEMNKFYLTLKDIYKRDNEIDAAIAYIRENYHRDISMTMVANFVSINYTNFSILFREETGTGFVDYLRQVRIDKAKELLRTTGYKVNEISELVGFKNPKHFMKSFKLTVGISPAEYRNKPV